MDDLAKMAAKDNENAAKNAAKSDENMAKNAAKSNKNDAKNAKKSHKFVDFFKNFESKHKRFCEFARFIIVGCFSTLIDIFVMGVVLYIFDPSLYPNFFNVFYGGGDPATIATVVGTGAGFLISLTFSYFMSVRYVYDEKGNSKSAKGIILFVTLSAVGLLINTLGMWAGYELLKINEWLVKIVVIIVVLFWNYFTRKIFIFNGKSNKKE